MGRRDPIISFERLFVVALSAVQDELGLSESQFAAKLGIGRPLWNRTRSGKKRLGMTLLRGAVRMLLSEDGRRFASFVLRSVPVGTLTAPGGSESESDEEDEAEEEAVGNRIARPSNGSAPGTGARAVRQQEGD